jgi:hypothetical protein
MLLRDKIMNAETEQIILDSLLRIWPGGLVPRSEIRKSGLTAPGSLANADCKGVGVEGKLQIGGKIFYPAENLASWLAAR